MTTKRMPYFTLIRSLLFIVNYAIVFGECFGKIVRDSPRTPFHVCYYIYRLT
ncbi:hypothetical protein L4C38_10025 [Vibrio kasasachensis]|uniref:hypothetical protein n=1 Tax=Vibrio kasasachensis TaxID=2910248 RepID=UPI003D103A9C